MSLRTFFTDIEHIRTIDIRRIAYAITFLLSFILTELGRNYYRPYIYENNINDLGIADSIGNLGGIIVQIFFGLMLLNSSKKKGFHVIAFFIGGYILYEILQPILPKGVFDWLDIYGTILGGFVAILLYLLIHVMTKKNKILYKF
jgi:glycopeptide antibiotics resistance protein